jgi:hypothetical protein
LESLKGTDNSGDLGVDETIILQHMVGKYDEDVEWIHVVQER